jgi:uncharacterized membrane protein
MLIFIILALIIGGCYLGFRYSSYNYHDHFAITGFISGFILCALLFALPIARCDYNSRFVEFNETSNTIKEARKNKDISEFELAAMQTKVIESNNWLARTKYWNNTIWDYYIPEKIVQLESIK